MAVRHLTLSRAGPHGNKPAGRSRPGTEKQCFLNLLQLIHLGVAAVSLTDTIIQSPDVTP